MKIKVDYNQTIYDLSVHYFGTVEALPVILSNNADLVNDHSALVAIGIDYLSDSGFYFDIPIAPGTKVEIDTTHPLCNRQTTKELKKHITTYGTHN